MATVCWNCCAHVNDRHEQNDGHKKKSIFVYRWIFTGNLNSQTSSIWISTFPHQWKLNSKFSLFTNVNSASHSLPSSLFSNFEIFDEIDLNFIPFSKRKAKMVFAFELFARRVSCFGLFLLLCFFSPVFRNWTCRFRLLIISLQWALTSQSFVHIEQHTHTHTQKNKTICVEYTTIHPEMLF